MIENKDYTFDDHLFRDKDTYAQTKYDITIDWLLNCETTGKLLLNIGCGAGHFNNQAEKKLNCIVKAYEPEPNIYKQALKNCQSPNIEVYNHTLNTINLDSPADFLVMHDVLEHIDNDSDAVKTLSQLLSEKSKAIISVPSGEFLFGHHDIQLGHFRRYTKSTLTRVLSKYFEIEKIRYFGMSFIPIVMWYSVLQKKNYPVNSASGGLGKAILDFLCKTEAKVSAPIGTSIIAMVRPK